MVEFIYLCKTSEKWELASVIPYCATTFKQFSQSIDYSTKWEKVLSQKNTYLSV